MNRHKVLIIRAGALGDTLMLMPSIYNLRLKAGIILAGRHPGIDYIKPYVDLCIDYESSGWHRLFVKGAAKEQWTAIPGVSHVVAFLSDPEGAVAENLRACMPSASVHIFPALPQSGEKVHVALYMAGALETSGLPIDSLKAFSDSRKYPLLAEKVMPERKGGIILQPGSGSENKNYPPALWLELINIMKRTDKGRSEKIIFLMGPSEEKLLPFFREGIDKSAYGLRFNPEREELLSLLGRASLYIGHDSGTTHLAAMLGTPVMALFKDSSIQQWAPLGPKVKIVRSERDETVFMRNFQDIFQKIFNFIDNS